MARHLFIVSRAHQALYDYLLERFRTDEKVTVILDRRVGDRRRGDGKTEWQGVDRRREERRRKTPPDNDLTTRSHQIITIEDC